MNYPSDGLFGEDNSQQFSEVNWASDVSRLKNFYPPPLNGLMPSSEETNLNQNKSSFCEISDNSNMNSTIIRRISLGREELANSFEPSLQDQIEGIRQMDIITPIVTQMVCEESPNQGSDQILPENIFLFNPPGRTKEETPNQADIETYNLIPASNEDSSNQDLSQTPTFRRTDNLNKEIFITPMICLKTLVKKRYGLNIDSFNCGEVLGKKIKEKKIILPKNIRDILSEDEDISDRIEKILDSDIDTSKKEELNYFLSMKYEELFEHYKRNDKNFQISKGNTLTINEFITLEKAIEIKREQYGNIKKYKNNQALLELKLEKFEKNSKTIIVNIKNGKRQREKIKYFKIRKVKRKRRGEA